MSDGLLRSDEDVLEARARIFRALGDETRLRIVAALVEADEALSVSEVCDRTGMAQNLASHHLRCLENCALAEVEQRGRRRLYELSREEVVAILKLADECIRDDIDGVLGCDVVESEES